MCYISSKQLDSLCQNVSNVYFYSLRLRQKSVFYFSLNLFGKLVSETSAHHYFLCTFIFPPIQNHQLMSHLIIINKPGAQRFKKGTECFSLATNRWQPSRRGQNVTKFWYIRYVNIFVLTQSCRMKNASFCSYVVSENVVWAKYCVISENFVSVFMHKMFPNYCAPFCRKGWWSLCGEFTNIVLFYIFK